MSPSYSPPSPSPSSLVPLTRSKASAPLEQLVSAAKRSPDTAHTALRNRPRFPPHPTNDRAHLDTSQFNARDACCAILSDCFSIPGCRRRSHGPAGDGRRRDVSSVARGVVCRRGRGHGAGVKQWADFREYDGAAACVCGAALALALATRRPDWILLFNIASTFSLEGVHADRISSCATARATPSSSAS